MQIDQTNRVLLATAAVLAIATLIRLGQSSQAPEAMWSTSAVTETQVRAISFKKPEGAVQLERADAGWRMNEPSSVSVEAQKVSTLLGDWSEPFGPDLKLADSVSEDDLAAYGLDEAQRTELSLVGSAGPLVELHIGKSIAGGSHYLRRPSDRGVYRGRVPGVFRLQTGEEAWRDMGLFAFDKDEVTSVQLTNSHGDFHFVRSSGAPGTWTAERPPGFRVASRSIDTMSRSLANLKAQKMLEGAEAQAVRSRAGLDNARVVVRVGQGTSSKSEQVLRFGAEDDPNHTVFAQVDGRDSLFVVSMGAFRQFDKSRSELQDRTVLSFERSPAVEVRFVEGELAVVAIPDGARDWKVVLPEGAGASDAELKLAMNSLVNLQAAELQADNSAADTGPESPRIEVKSPTGTQILRIGKGPIDGKYLATVDGRSELFVLRGTVVERLLKVFRAQKP